MRGDVPNKENCPDGRVFHVQRVGIEGDVPNTKNMRIVACFPCPAHGGWKGMHQTGKTRPMGVFCMFGAWGMEGDIPNTKNTPKWGCFACSAHARQERTRRTQ